ncbi:MAG TPA: hypothetical protein VFS11_04375 [Gemmatimonadales bacterium]|nr:hypothetical protein [Gemmatimonadales bacterium]
MSVVRGAEVEMARGVPGTEVELSMDERATIGRRRARCDAFALAALMALGALPAIAAPARAQELGHRWDVTVETPKPTVGDSVTVRFRVVLHERDLLSDTMPRPPDSLPDGVRVLAVDVLKRNPDRTMSGRATLAFYRPGKQRIPSFSIPFLRVTANLRGNIVSDTNATIEIAPTLPPGNPPLRDIKPIERVGGVGRWAYALAAAVLLAFGVAWTRRRARRRPPEAPLGPPPEADGPGAVVLGPYEVALARLVQAEREHWPARGDVARHYEAVADALRRYLAEAESVPALEYTTAELVWALPAALSENGLREEAAEFFGEADLVKFARLRPDEIAASRYLRAARALLERWHAAAGAATREAADALR